MNTLLATHTVTKSPWVAAEVHPGIFVADSGAVIPLDRIRPDMFVELPSPGPCFDVDDDVIDRAQSYHDKGLGTAYVGRFNSGRPSPRSS